MRIPVLLLLVTLGNGGTSTAAPVTCGKLLVPKTWSLRRSDGWLVRNSCAIALAPSSWPKLRAQSLENVSDRAISIEVYKGTLETACDDVHICKERERWWSLGRAGARNELASLSTRAGVGVIDLVEVGAYLKRGGYHGTAQAFIALIDSGRGEIAIFVADPEFKDRKTFDSVVKSFRFKSAA